MYLGTILILFLFSTVFIVSDLNDVTFMYTKMFLLYNYTVTVNAYLGNTYNEIFKYYYSLQSTILLLCSFSLCALFYSFIHHYYYF